MNRRSFGYGLLFFGLALAGIVLMTGRGGTAGGGSAASPSPGGLLAARLYLESRGAAVELLDQPLSPAALEGRTLVLAGPFQRPFDGEARSALREHLRRGGRVIYGYTTGLVLGPEGVLQDELGLGKPEDLRDPPPLAPWRWKRHRDEIFRLEPEPAAPLRRSLEVAAFDRAPKPPDGAQVFYRAGAKMEPVVFEYPLQQEGRVLVLPAALLANAELAHAGNADLLELILAGAPAGIAFDELRHGVAKIEESGPDVRLGWNAFLLQVLLIYLTAVWALGRSFGPAWAERIPALGSTAAFFEQLGSLHERFRHHQGAARSLVERARALDPQVPAELADRPVKKAADFLRLAREVAQYQLARRSKQ